MAERGGSVVFVHGAGAGGWEWAAWSRVFAAAGWQVLAPDLRAAPAGLAATRLQDYAAQVRGWLAAAPRPRVAVGASLGGLLVAMNADLADALVLVNPMPPAGSPGAARRPAIVPWGRRATLSGTRRAMPGADDAAALHAFRRWRDESGAVLDEAAAGLALPVPTAPVLVLGCRADTDVPFAASAALAAVWPATFLPIEGGHVDPLLGRSAPFAANQALAWLQERMGSGNICVSNAG